MKFNDLRVGTKIRLNSLGPLSLLVVVSALTILGLNSIADSTKWVEHTHAVIGQAKAVQSSAIDMETGMRGFLLAGDDAFLDPYHGGSKSFDALSGELKNTVSDNPAQVKLVSHMQGLINTWRQEVAEPNIATRRLVGQSATMDEMVAIVGKAEGKKFFDGFRADVKLFIERESKLMQQRQKHAQHTHDRTKLFVIGTSLFTILASLILSQIVTSSIVNPVNHLMAVLSALAQKDLSQHADESRKDEIGQIGRAINQAITGIADSIDVIQTNASAVASSASELLEASTEIEGSSNETSGQVSEVSTASAGVSQSLETVAAGAEEMSVGIRNISDNAVAAASVAEQGAKLATSAQQIVNELGDSSKEIASVVALITSIADQTNLLALNATIEAARAGESGKGFAVVANEVKELANETGKATSEISARVEGIRDASINSVEVMGKISQIIDEISSYQTTIAETVGQQSETATDVSRSVSSAASSSSQITSTMSDVSVAADRSRSGATRCTKMAGELEGLASSLQKVAHSFRRENDNSSRPLSS